MASNNYNAFYIWMASKQVLYFLFWRNLVVLWKSVQISCICYTKSNVNPHFKERISRYLGYPWISQVYQTFSLIQEILSLSFLHLAKFIDFTTILDEYTLMKICVLDKSRFFTPKLELFYMVNIDTKWPQKLNPSFENACFEFQY